MLVLWSHLGLHKFEPSLKQEACLRITIKKRDEASL